MSRSGYSEDGCDNVELYRQAVENAINGRRGQAFFRELIASLDAMPEKRLIAGDLRKQGEVCAIGAVGLRRGVDMEKLDPENPEEVAKTFGIATCLAQEIVFENDEREEWRGRSETPEQRWQRMRHWATENLKQA